MPSVFLPRCWSGELGSILPGIIDFFKQLVLDLSRYGRIRLLDLVSFSVFLKNKKEAYL